MDFDGARQIILWVITVSITGILAFILHLIAAKKRRPKQTELHQKQVAEIMQKHREAQSMNQPNIREQAYEKLDKSTPSIWKNQSHVDLTYKRYPVIDAAINKRITNSYLSVKQKSGLDLLIKYPSRDGLIERRVTVYGLGKYERSHYLVGHCHSRGERRTFKLQNFRNCIDLSTGEMITRVKDYILAYNPVIEDLTDEFNAIREENDRKN